LISKIILGLISIIILFQAHQVYADEELPIIIINFVSGNVIDLDESPQMIRADVLIHNYNPQDGYTYMEVTRVSDGEIIKDTEVMPKAIAGDEDNLFQVQILHYVEPGVNATNMIGDYILRIFSEIVLSAYQTKTSCTQEGILSDSTLSSTSSLSSKIIALMESFRVSSRSSSSSISQMVTSSSSNHSTSG